jgi:GNAT superfamily N-acetyltransferase
MQAYLEKDWNRVMERGLTVRRIGLEDLKTGALFDLHRLSQIGFAGNPLFAPLGFEAFARSYLQGKTGKENFIYMAYDAAGRAIAFFLAFLEPTHFGQPQKTLVLKTAATDPDYRRQGLSNALLYAICRDLPESVSDNYISALVFQGWTSESFARHGKTLWEHQYVLMAKDLT